MYCNDILLESKDNHHNENNGTKKTKHNAQDNSWWDSKKLISVDKWVEWLNEAIRVSLTNWYIWFTWMVLVAYIYSNKCKIFAYRSLGKITIISLISHHTYLLHWNTWHCTGQQRGIGFRFPHIRSRRKSCMCEVQDCSNTADSDQNIALLLLEDGKLCVLQKK